MAGLASKMGSGLPTRTGQSDSGIALWNDLGKQREFLSAQFGIAKSADYSRWTGSDRQFYRQYPDREMDCGKRPIGLSFGTATRHQFARYTTSLTALTGIVSLPGSEVAP